MVRMRVFAVAALAALMTLGGCNTVKKSAYDAAVSENAELRERLGEAQASLTEVNEQNRQLTAQNQQLMEENMRLQNQAAANRASDAAGVGDFRATGRGEMVATIAGDVLFRPGQATITEEGKRTLDRIAAQINTQFAGRTVRVEGYTDSDPIRKSNWKSNEHLSAERALAVEQYLVSKGVDNDRIYSAAFGPARPKSSKASSRRVEIVILAN
ncbi:MAG: hypothetical protein Kow0022_10920 [Phycisphaerales bacterium]